jgi:acetate kinase
LAPSEGESGPITICEPDIGSRKRRYPFCYQARRFLGALAIVLGGLDTLVFTGGILENAPSIRRRICENTDFLGIHLDPDQNDANAPILFRRGSAVAVRMIRTN